MMDTGAREGEVRPANEIFTLLSEGHGLAVILDALASRDGVGEETRSELSARIRKLRIKGFRDANRAPHDRLVETILDAIAEGDHGLAAAILATWMQTHSVLRERAAAHLRGRGIDVVDAPPVRFTSCWDTDEWLLERNRMLRDSDGAHAHRDDAALMLSLLSGRFPGPPPVESELFRTWIDTLWDLPASAPEWPDDAANLGRWVRYILREKERELIEGVVRKIADQWNGIDNEFNDDLDYLGIGPLTLQAPPGGPELLIGTLEFLAALRVQLEAYRPLRPQAASRQEELERSEARRAAEEGILKLTAEWRERMARARQAQGAATAARRAEPAVEEEEPPTGKQADADPAAVESFQTNRGDQPPERRLPPGSRSSGPSTDRPRQRVVPATAGMDSQPTYNWLCVGLRCPRVHGDGPDPTESYLSVARSTPRTRGDTSARPSYNWLYVEATLVTLVGMAARALLADAGFVRHSTPNTEANWRGVPFGTMQEPPQPAAARDGCTSPIAEREQCHLALRKAPGLPKDVWARSSEPGSRWRTVRAALANGDASGVLDGRVTLATQWSAADRHCDGRSRFAYSLRNVRDAEPTRRPDVAPSLRAHSRSVALGRERCPAPRPTTRAG